MTRTAYDWLSCNPPLPYLSTKFQPGTQHIGGCRTTVFTVPSSSTPDRSQDRPCVSGRHFVVPADYGTMPLTRWYGVPCMMTLQHTLRRASFHLTPRTRELRGRYKTRVASFKFQTLVVTTVKSLTGIVTWVPRFVQKYY